MLCPNNTTPKIITLNKMPNTITIDSMYQAIFCANKVELVSSLLGRKSHQ